MVAASGPSGTALVFNNYPVTVASKTGTPETSDLCNSVFIAFAPAEDPEIAIAVVIENGWHGFTSAPVAKDLFNIYFGLL
jgi:penicillin-binding protein 2